MKNVLYCGFSIIFLFTLIGCVAKPIYLAENYDQKSPSTVAIFPLADSVLTNEDQMDLINSIEKKVASNDYDVICMKTVDALLKNSSFSKALDTSKTTISKICLLTNSDAVLFCVLGQYESNYQVIYKKERLIINFSLYNNNGELLWKHKIDNEMSSGLNLLAALDSRVDIWLTNCLYTLPDGRGKGAIR